MSVETQRAIARRGGLRAQALGRGHTFTSQTAAEAGRAGDPAKKRRRWWTT